jgi:DNA-binding NtrC family response regulator
MRHGIAMHGEPALSPGFAYLPFVNPDAPKGGRLIMGQQGTFDSLNAFVVRGVGRRMTIDGTSAELPRSASQLKELVGRVPLKDLVRETTDVIEQLCIEAALEITGDNRASAAEILGLSRQSLYVKLRRYGLGDIEAE